MDCTAAILKACARSRSKWCRHQRSASARATLGCCRGHGRGGAASFLHRLLVYICWCRSSEESSELCQEWADPPLAGRGRGEDEGEAEEFRWALQDSCASIPASGSHLVRCAWKDPSDADGVFFLCFFKWFVAELLSFTYQLR